MLTRQVKAKREGLFTEQAQRRAAFARSHRTFGRLSFTVYRPCAWRLSDLGVAGSMRGRGAV